MEFSIVQSAPGSSRSGCVIVGVYESRKLSMPAAALDSASRGFITTVLKSGDMDGRKGTTLTLHGVPHIACERVLLVGLGAEKSFDEKAYREALATTMRALKATGAVKAECHLSVLDAGKSSITWRVAQAAALAMESVYRFETMKSKREDAPPALKQLALVYANSGEREGAQRGLTQGVALGRGMNLAKDLGNLPGNVCTPSYLAREARALAAKHRMKATVLDRPQMQKLGMGTLLSDRKSTRLNSSHIPLSRMPSSA